MLRVYINLVRFQAIGIASLKDQLQIKVQIISDLKNMKLKHEDVKFSIYAQIRSPRQNHCKAKIPYWTLLQVCLSMSSSSWHWGHKINDSGEVSKLKAYSRSVMDILYVMEIHYKIIMIRLQMGIMSVIMQKISDKSPSRIQGG